MHRPRALPAFFRLPAFLVALVALSVLNPFCSSDLPLFVADVLQTEENVEEQDEPSPEKPAAVRDDAVRVAAPAGVLPGGDFLFSRERIAASVRWLSTPSFATPPRHKVFGVYRV